MNDKVVSLIKYKQKKNQSTLNELLKRAKILKKIVIENDGLILCDFNGLERFFESRIVKILMENQIVDVDVFLCSVYISRLLALTAFSEPKSWYAIDYMLENFNQENPQIIKKGADVCFLLCSLFQEKAKRRLMSVDDYQTFGVGLYNQFYFQTDLIVGRHMSNNFELMAEVTKESMQKIL